MAKSLLILGAGRNQLPAIVAAKEMGLRTIVIDPSPDAVGFASADETHVLDIANVEQCLGIARKSMIDGVMTLAADFPVPTVGAICEDLGLHGLNRSSALKSTNKREMRNTLGSAGMPCPGYVHVTSINEAKEAYDGLGGETIIKPTLSNGGRGITRLTERASGTEIIVAFERAQEASRGDGVLVEEFVDGPEFSVEALTCDGQTHIIAVTDKVTSGPPYYVEMGHSQPSRSPQSDIDLLASTAIDGVRALGIDWSASHTEIRLGRCGPRVMEIGGRLGGGFITTNLVPLSSGIDMVKCAVTLALGKKPDYGRMWSRGAAVRFLTAVPGVIQSIDGVDQARLTPSVEIIELYVEPGAEVVELVDASSRIGHVICSSETAESAVARTKEASDHIAVMTCA